MDGPSRDGGRASTRRSRRRCGIPRPGPAPDVDHTGSPAASPAQIFRTLRREAVRWRRSATGEVGQLFRGDGIEMVCVVKQGEKIDPGWFSSARPDLIVVIDGQLCIEFDDPGRTSRVLRRGDVVVLPPRTRCRAYRWPRSSRGAAVFIAVYPCGGREGGRGTSRTTAAAHGLHPGAPRAGGRAPRRKRPELG